VPAIVTNPLSHACSDVDQQAFGITVSQRGEKDPTASDATVRERTALIVLVEAFTKNPWLGDLTQS
jgi:hypothetical protein